MNLCSLKAHFNRAIAQSENKHVLRSSSFQPTSLIAAISASRPQRTVNADAPSVHRRLDPRLWKRNVGANSDISGVVVHSISTSTMDTEKFQEVRDEILQANKAFLAIADIKYISWLTRKPPNKSDVVHHYRVHKTLKPDGVRNGRYVSWALR
jgi:hypothetical protein